MIVTIPTVRVPCPASNAIHMENVPYRTVLMDQDTSYSQLFIDLIQAGNAFMTIEHDVVPWPGALQALWECDAPWCQHLSFVGPGKLAQGIGSFKMSAAGAVALQPHIDRWRGVHWSQLDGSVIPLCNQVLGQTHWHTPPFAHARGVW